MINELRILLANEPRSYREAIARVVEALKPHARVKIAEPEELDRESKRFAPHLVICSRLSSVVEGVALARVELYPEHESLGRVRIDKECYTVEGIELADLLSVIDRTEDLINAAQDVA